MIITPITIALVFIQFCVIFLISLFAQVLIDHTFDEKSMFGAMFLSTVISSIISYYIDIEDIN